MSVHVLYDGRRKVWSVRRDGSPADLASHESQEKAVEEAVRIASRECGEVVLHAREGGVVQRASFPSGAVPGSS
jgi:hypothetical protein